MKYLNRIQNMQLIVLIIGVFVIMSGCQRQGEYSLSYGVKVSENGSYFRILAPRASQVYLVIFDNHEDDTGKEFAMERDPSGSWSTFHHDAGYGTLYGYRLEGPKDVNDPSIIIADPYSLAAVTQNTHRHIAKSLIVDTSYDWEGDTFSNINPHDLMISEVHLRDMTAHASSESGSPGTYAGFTELDQRGGIAHIKDMGYNAVQILPLHDFANVEVPFHDSSAHVYNTWNPYARNHWGYMTTFFFAPESYYTTNGTNIYGAWNGTDGRAVNELKDLVKILHKNGIAVILDVVYNHVSNYDYHPLKYIDKELYFRLDEKGEYIAQSGCGNDCRTESEAMRNLILESVLYWIREYHIDGFRFDLGNLIDPITRHKILDEVRKINPKAIILAEPWGGGYDPSGFSQMDWASFNDQIRNGVKGQNPFDGLGFIFGKWQGDNSPASLKRYVMGSPVEYGGQYQNTAHSVNYLESHDDHTFGDFVRLGSELVNKDDVVTDRKENAIIRGRQLAMQKLGAMFLFTSQGITFIHQGQEWGRSKIIAQTDVPDPAIGTIDHNSYEKDNETNWLNWDEKSLNKDLVDYYRGLINLRKSIPEFRRSSPEDFQFFDFGNSTAVGYILKDKYIVLMNGEQQDHLNLELPDGDWFVLADAHSIDLSGKHTLYGSVGVNPVSGLILKRQ
jgi:pullulanase/glycogen debranching enzyme